MTVQLTTKLLPRNRPAQRKNLDHFEFHKVFYRTKLQDIFSPYLNNIWKNEYLAFF